MVNCIKCGAPANKEVISMTGKAKCVPCCIKGYKFVLMKMHQDISKLEMEISKLKQSTPTANEVYKATQEARKKHNL